MMLRVEVTPDPRGRRIHSLRGLVLTLLVTALILSVPGIVSPSSVAQATPRDEVLARAAEIKSQVDSLDKQTETLSEDFNAARVRQEQLAQQEKAAADLLEETTKRTEVLQGRLSSRAASMYRNGPLGFIDVFLGASDFEAFARTWDFLKKMNEDDAQTVQELRVAKAEQAEAQEALKRRTDQAVAVSLELAARRREIEAMISDRKRMLVGFEAQVAELDRAEERRRAAVAARAARRPSTADREFPPPAQAARSEVVSVAKRYLGAPYVWGAAGPDSFDCSGFTSFVYKQVGVTLPRVSRDQINAGERVSRDDLQPGDLVFFGSPIHHVGIYVGGGTMIHSPRTGDVVKISPLHDDYVGASRP
ncbi:MAG: hypothetical protein CVT69_01215 [Actinobacteria bacterium HGW-Actinobacteria-9]|jgi:cell wall-associated NlpC family hydrolase|nr:MAG: hypothetical protein CVT69_01215 [Actinobacteria bacterium HGW-Actinobacteria-9]